MKSSAHDSEILECVFLNKSKPIDLGGLNATTLLFFKIIERHFANSLNSSILLVSKDFNSGLLYFAIL